MPPIIPPTITAPLPIFCHNLLEEIDVAKGNAAHEPGEGENAPQRGIHGEIPGKDDRVTEK